MRVRTRKGIFELVPDTWTGYKRLYVDVFSIAASLSRPEELFSSAAEAGVDVIFVVDAWHESHLPLTRRYVELCRRYGLECRLSERMPAELYAVELCEAECGEGCAVLTRDYDATMRAVKCAVLMFRNGRLWRAARVDSTR